KVPGTNFYTDAKKLKMKKMLKGGKATYDRSGKIIKEAQFQSRLAPGTQVRIEPNRRWFENTRVIQQKDLTAFRDAMATQLKDPNTFLLHRNKLPMALLTDPANAPRMHILDTNPFGDTFGPKAQRKRPQLHVESLNELKTESDKKVDDYAFDKDAGALANADHSGMGNGARDFIFGAGQSRRIWGELYKVIDSSDVIIHVLDARDPEGTRCRNVEKYLKKECSHKHLIFLLNKCDLIPTKVLVS
ncbi:NGP1NT-domain-containing protein, partial [Caulochytrium protostelioides]